LTGSPLITPQSIVLQHLPFLSQRTRRNRSKPQIVVGLDPAIVRNLRRFQFRQDAVQRLHVWNSDENNIWNALALRMQGSDAVRGVVRLDDLMFDGNVLSDEQVGVAIIDLCHGGTVARADSFSQQLPK